MVTKDHIPMHKNVVLMALLFVTRPEKHVLSTPGHTMVPNLLFCMWYAVYLITIVITF